MRRDNIAVRTWDNIPGWGQFAIIGGTLVVGGIAVKKGLNRFSERKRLKEQEKLFKQSQVPVSITDGKGQVVTVTLNTATAATKIYDAIYNNDAFGWTEDETTIVNTLKAIPKAYIPDVVVNYKTLYKKNLQEDVVKALDQDEWQKVDHLFN